MGGSLGLVWEVREGSLGSGFLSSYVKEGERRSEGKGTIGRSLVLLFVDVMDFFKIFKFVLLFA